MSSLLSHPVSFFVEYSSYICSSLKIKTPKNEITFYFCNGDVVGDDSIGL